MNYWKFTKTDFIEESSFNPILERFYQYGVRGLTRENIQNSLDARLESNGPPVHVIIQTGKMQRSEIPGYSEIENRVKSLQYNNSYVKETLDDMVASLDKSDYNYISFEDMHTKGLTGADKGQNDDKRFSYSAYAYSKGVHYVDPDRNIEKQRGGSHGIGKIASNSASNLYTMFFANCDEDGYQTLGGTIQLIEHKFNGQFYRSTGYFSDERDGKLYPYENKGFSNIFVKRTRGLKIVIPFLREQFFDVKEIIRAVCDSFMLAIMSNTLTVVVDGALLSKDTIQEYIKDENYFTQRIEDIREDFTPLYLSTYLNFPRKILEIEDMEKTKYKFYFCLQYNERISTGRTGIFRSIGMKIEDKKITSQVNKPYNAVLLPYSKEEDVFLKSLENESHTKLEYTHIKNPSYQKNAKKFISNLNNTIAKEIENELNKHNPTDGSMDTSDILYEIERKFNNDLKKRLTEVHVGDGDNKKTVVKTSDTNEQGESSKSRRRGKKRDDYEPSRVKKEFGKDGAKNYYVLPKSAIKRVIIDQIEMLDIQLGNSDFFEGVSQGNLLISLIDGMGLEHKEEYNLKQEYEAILDKNQKKKLPCTINSIKYIDISRKQISLELRISVNSKDCRNSKLKYYLEV